ncbi:MAG TPA: GNAT family N-acetyltransferase [Candidatus Binatia bacterium]|nr:GNAT family N-acetyltransferase [Candidatus Binatia bacterium]
MNDSDVRRFDFEIRKADVSDAQVIAVCLAAAFAEYRKLYRVGAFADTVLNSGGVERRLREMFLFVAVSSARIVGTIGCVARGTDGHLRGLAVLPEWQGTGVATGLLEAAEAELRARRCCCITLETTEPLKRAVRFYEKHGYSASGRVSDFFGMRLFEYSKVLL